MTEVRVLVQADRVVLAGHLVEQWRLGRAVWVLDPVTTPAWLAGGADGLLDGPTRVHLARTGRATVDLDVPADTATLVSSSGTTGPPRVLALSAANLDASADGAHHHLGASVRDRWLVALPLHHVAGQSVVWRARRLGHDPVVQARFDPLAAGRDGTTLVSLVPTQLRRLVDACAHLPATVLLGGGAISPRLLADVAAGGHVRRVVRSYGLTETAGGCVYDGVAFPDVEVAVSDGRIRVRGPVVSAGRLTTTGIVPVTDAAGWLATDDLGAVDADGIVSVVGRADDVIISGGVNVAPAAVEVVLEDHPHVDRAGVVGLVDPEWGEVVAAAVTTTGVDLDVAGLQDLVRARLGAAAVPRRIRRLDRLPLTGLGKVQRAALRRRFS